MLSLLGLAHTKATHIYSNIPGLQGTITTSCQ